MASYDLNLVFCTEAQVQAAGGYTWTTSDTPDDTKVYTFAQWACGQIVLLTTKAGSTQSPPASGIGDVHLRNTLVEANAVGAAYMAWRTMAKGGDPHAKQMRDQLREDWIRFIGGTAANGTEVTGSIAEAVEIATGGNLARTDETAGIVVFPAAATATTLGRRFTDADRD